MSWRSNNGAMAKTLLTGTIVADRVSESSQTLKEIEENKTRRKKRGRRHDGISRGSFEMLVRSRRFWALPRWDDPRRDGIFCMRRKANTLRVLCDQLAKTERFNGAAVVN
jgi:hypothetical protein